MVVCISICTINVHRCNVLSPYMRYDIHCDYLFYNNSDIVFCNYVSYEVDSIVQLIQVHVAKLA